MTPRTRRRSLRRRPRSTVAPRMLRRSAVPDATIEPDPGPAPEAVFDRVTGPYVRRSFIIMPGVPSGSGREDA